MATMTAPTDALVERLEGLATRCEAASGASRHLDVQTFILFDPEAQHIVDQEPGPFPRKAIYGPRISFWEWACDKTREPPEFAVIPRFTASLDAAMTLVPEGRDGVRMDCRLEDFHVSRAHQQRIARLSSPFSGERAEGRSRASLATPQAQP